MAAERLQKVLARAGVASRRGAEQLITAGRVRVDGQVVSQLGTTVDARHSRVEVDGQTIAAEPLVYLVWHKPREVMSTMHDPEGRDTVADHLRGVGARVLPVGRLDYHTSGVMLLTNDGEFASRLSHPRAGALKEYVAKVKGAVNDEALERWKQSIVIEGRSTRPADVRRLRQEGDKTWLSVVIQEGRNRQVRRLGDAAGFSVMRLARVGYAGISVEGLKPGQWRYLTVDELKDLKRRFGVPARVRPATAPEGSAPRRPTTAKGARGRGARPGKGKPHRVGKRSTKSR
jgi:23S rRNA pseudouridine2605 synthase